MKKTIITLALVMGIAFNYVIPAGAAIPNLITYEGVLKDSSGNFLTGSYDIVFRVYSASTGGSSLWSETHSNVTVTSGRFAVSLGSVTTLDLNFDQSYWISLQVESDSEMTPRQQLTSVGYAYMAEKVVNGFDQAEHDELDHKDIEGVKANTALIAKTNFKLAAYSTAAAYDLGNMVIDTFSDDDGIDAGSSDTYTWRGSPNYDVVVESSSGDVVEQCTGDNDYWETFSNWSTTQKGIGERFKHSSAVTVDRIIFKLSKAGSPTGNVRAKIYSDSSGYPGTQLGESANYDISTLSTSYQEITLTLTSGVSLSADTYYHAVLESVDASGSGANYVKVSQAGSGNPYTNGYPVNKNSSNAWGNLGDNYDIYFKVYEQAAAAGSADVRSIAFTQGSAPSTVMIIADETLNEGSITYYASRNNGTTWTECDKGILCDISAQSSGTNLKWRAEIEDDAELEAIAIAI